MTTKTKVSKKKGSWMLELKTFYFFPETEVLVDEDEIEDFIKNYPHIEDKEYYEVRLQLQKIFKLRGE